jgi:uncharacterized protein YutE (UPF0331/DUF86 family)
MTSGSPDKLLLRRHLLALDGALTRLARHATVTSEAYLANPELQWAVERGLLICAQNVFDIAAHISAGAGLDSPDYAASIDALASLGVLPRAFASTLRPLAGFRNVLVHAYLTVDPLRVHEVLTQRLPELRAFAGHVEQYLAGLPSA